MEEKTKLNKGWQILFGIILGAIIYGLYYVTFPALETILTYIYILALSIGVIFIIVKLLKSEDYKTIGVTLTVVVTPILLFSLLAGTCVTFFF